MSGGEHLDHGFGPLEYEWLPDDERREADRHLAACDRCAGSFRDAAEALTSLSLALPSMAPPHELRARVLESIAQANRFEPFAGQVAELLALGVTEARALLARIDDAAAWVTGELPFVLLLHITPGARLLPDALAGFVRLAPGAIFPEHDHLGDELALVLQGSCADSDGSIARRGDLVRRGPGEAHALTALPGPDFIYLAVVQQGIVIGGRELRAGDPRL